MGFRVTQPDEKRVRGFRITVPEATVLKDYQFTEPSAPGPVSKGFRVTEPEKPDFSITGLAKSITDTITEVPEILKRMDIGILGQISRTALTPLVRPKEAAQAIDILEEIERKPFGVKSFIGKFPEIPEKMFGVPSQLIIPQLFPIRVGAYKKLGEFERKMQVSTMEGFADMATSPIYQAMVLGGSLAAKYPPEGPTPKQIKINRYLSEMRKQMMDKAPPARSAIQIKMLQPHAKGIARQINHSIKNPADPTAWKITQPSFFKSGRGKVMLESMAKGELSTGDLALLKNFVQPTASPLNPSQLMAQEIRFQLEATKNGTVKPPYDISNIKMTQGALQALAKHRGTINAIAKAKGAVTTARGLNFIDLVSNFIGTGEIAFGGITREQVPEPAYAKEAEEYLARRLEEERPAKEEIPAEVYDKIIAEEPEIKPAVEKPVVKGELISEARKYKSAEEFVEAQPKSYHGTGANFTEFKLPKDVPEDYRTIGGNEFGIYFTKNKTLAENFGTNIQKRVLDIQKPLDLTGVKTFDEMVDKLPIDKKKFEFELKRMKADSIFGEIEVRVGAYRELEKLNDKFNITEKLTKQNYDAIIFDDATHGNPMITTVVWDTSKIKTEKQLEELWKQAQAKPEVKPAVAAVPREIKPIEKPVIIKTPITPGKVKPLIHKVTGIKKPEKVIVTTEMNLLKAKLQAEQRASKKGEEVGRVETRKKIYISLQTKKAELKDIRRSIIDYAADNLTKVDRKTITIMASKATTRVAMAKVFSKIDTMEEVYQRHVAVDNLKKVVSGLDLKKTRPEYKKLLGNIVSSLDLVNRRDKTIKGLQNMTEYIVRNPDNNIPEKELQRLSILNQRPIKNITTEDINLITASIQSLVRQHELKGKIILKRRISSFVDKVKEGVDTLKKKVVEPVEGRDPVQESKIKEISLDFLNMQHIAREILDKSDKGVFKEVLYDNINEGISKLLDFRQQADDYFYNKIKDIKGFERYSESFYPRKLWNKKVDYHNYKLESGRTLKVTKGERMYIAIQSRNEKALRRLLNGGYRPKKDPTTLYKLTGEDISMINKDVERSPENRILKAAHYYFNVTQKELLNETSVFLNGWEVATEADYFPLHTHGFDIRRNYLTAGDALPTNMKQFVNSTLEGMGILKARVANNVPILGEDFFVAAYKNIVMASTYYGLAEPLRTAKAFVFNKNIGIEITRRHGQRYLKAMKNYLKDIEGAYQRTDNIENLMGDIIDKLTSAALAINPFVIFKQPVSLLAVATEMEGEYFRKGLKEGPASIEEMSKYEPQLRDRFEGNVTRELGEIAQIGQVRRFWTHKTNLRAGMMKGIRRGDYEAIGRIWNMVKYETARTHPGLKGEERMKHIAQRTMELVELTQPTFHLKDRTAIARSRQWYTRLLTKFTSQRAKNFMMILRAVGKYNRSGKSGADKKKLAKDLSLLIILMPMLIMGIDELRNVLYKRKRKSGPMMYYTLRYLENLLGNVYFVGNVMRPLGSKIERGIFAGHDISDIFTSWGTSGINAIANIEKTIEQAISQEVYKAGDKKGELKWKTTMVRAIDRALSFGLRGFKGIPYDTMKKLLSIPFIHSREEEEGLTRKLDTSTLKVRKLK